MDDPFELGEPPPHLVDKQSLKGMPRQGIGRALKVSKEQIVTLPTALQTCASGAYDRERIDMQRRLERVAASLKDCPVRSDLIVPADGQSAPPLEITVDETRLRRSAFEVRRRLRRGSHTPA